jgi:hypothetical protein
MRLALICGLLSLDVIDCQEKWQGSRDFTYFGLTVFRPGEMMRLAPICGLLSPHIQLAWQICQHTARRARKERSIRITLKHLLYCRVGNRVFLEMLDMSCFWLFGNPKEIIKKR